MEPKDTGGAVAGPLHRELLWALASGSAYGISATLVGQPLDTIKTMMQTEQLRGVGRATVLETVGRMQQATVDCADKNFDALKPLAERLEHQGEVGMIRSFYEKFEFPTPNRNEIKREAKLAKAFMVLVKRKLQREQVCRSSAFKTLMALVFKNVPNFLQEGYWNLHVYGWCDDLWSVVRFVPD
eukprot:s815_g13.t1